MLEVPTSGLLRLAGRDVANADAATRKALRRTIQMVFQNPFASLNPRKKIGQALEEPLAINTDLVPAEREARARAMLARVGLRTEHYARYPHMFSGGQRQRIAIARALAVQPRLIVCDEPTSALDVSVQAQILNLLGQLQRDLGLSLLFITHNIGVVEYLADDIVVMQRGRVEEQGPTGEVLAHPQSAYTRTLLDAVPRMTVG